MAWKAQHRLEKVMSRLIGDEEVRRRGNVGGEARLAPSMVAPRS
jgi:hypothetical protein